MQVALARLVRERARNFCEYCRLAESLSVVPFEIDHIIAQKHHGPTEAENLALACFYCNNAKGPNIAGIDPMSRQLTRLFHPRRDQWYEHFRWYAAELFGLTAEGRTTIDVLNINDLNFVSLRESLIQEGIFPPSL